jgi:hypothetical protein
MALSLLFFNVSLDFTHFTLIWGYLQNRDAPLPRSFKQIIRLKNQSNQQATIHPDPYNFDN